MLTKDDSKSAIMKAVSECKSAVTLQGDNQKQDDSGHSSAAYGSGPDKSAAVPKGSPGTGY